MTDLRHNGTHKHNTLTMPKVLQQQQSLRDSYRSSCNSSPEPKTYPAAHIEQALPLANGHRNPLLKTLADHASMGSMSGGSTTSSTATTATATTIGRNCNGNTNGNVNMNGGGEIQFDEREIYYVSPSKRKGSIPGSAPLRSSLRACERLRSFSPTAATIAPSYPALTPSAAYGARAAHDMSFDSYEVSSHYSDTAMQVLRSGSCSGGAGGIISGSNLLATAAGNSNSSNSSLAHQHMPPTQRTQNCVTFANCDKQRTPQSNRGSLRRSKGRSSQSLCSCDAGADTEINPDPARPLYQYSLERRHKTHTYTCEQNAQILMRLERERNRKLSQGAGVANGLREGDAGDGADNDDNKDDVQSDTLSSSDVDTIPPVPPPPSMKRNGSMRSLRLLQLQHQQRSSLAVTNGTPASAIATLCSGDLLNDCGQNTQCDVGSVIDDCTTSILKCANAVGAEILPNKSNSNVATLATMASHAKPDVCHVGNHVTTSFSKYPPPLCIRDDIFAPNVKKSDPSLCFLHTNRDGVVGPGPDLSKAQHELQPSRSSTLSISKYNTIGPSSDYARQLSQYSQQLPQHQRITDRCRCFSQSFSNFSRDYFGHQRSESAGQMRSSSRDNHSKHVFHTGEGDPDDWLAPPVISRSYSNLVDIDGRHSRSRLPYQKFQTPANVFSSSCSFGTAAAANLLNHASFTTLSSSTNSGLKEKFQQHHHHHDHHHLLHSHHHQSAPPHRALHSHQQQQSAAQQQKHHQLHSSITSIMPWKHRQCPSRGSSSSGTNSFRFDAAKHWLAVTSILLIIGAASVAVPLALRVAATAPFEERLEVALKMLDQVPLIDGHNDLPWNIRKFLHNKLNDFNFDEDLRNVMPWARSHWSHTDLQRLKKGRVSAQFWAAYVPCEAQHRDAVQLTLEQIDVIKRLTDRYSPQLTTCTSADEIVMAHKNHQLCSLTGVEGGHSLGGSLAVLRTLYAIGVRYMTLTSTCHTPWADSSYADAPTFNVKHGGLTIFGKTIIREMNRLGMMVDLSHVSTGTMRDALEVSEAPVIFSHSSAYELCNSSRNVQDDMLQSLAKNGGIVMVNFYSKFLSCSENSTVHDAVAHINHIKRVAGIDHVGLGAGYDGINFTPKGLEDVSSYPTLITELLGEGWNVDELTKLASGNFLRVMRQVEKIRDEKKIAGVKPYEDHPNFRTDDPYNCTSS